MTDLEHFVRLAKRGKYPAASGGENRARRLAVAFLDNLPGLDGSALLGAMEFAEMVQGSPEEARTLVDAWE